MRATLYWVFALMILTFSVYYVEHHVEGLRSTVAKLHNQMEEDANTNAVLEAEWAYLTQPDRIATLTHSYLETEPMTMVHMQPVDVIPTVMVASANPFEAK